MSDERIERALRQGPPDEPAYTPMASVLIDAEVPGRAVIAERTRARHRSPMLPWYRRATSGLGALAAVVIVGVVLAAALLAREDLLRVGTPRPDALARIRASGTIRIAVTTGPPQVRGAGGSLEGFDIEVASALAEELGLRAVIDFASTDQLLEPSERSGWDLAFTAGAGSTGLRETAPYYHWPIWVVAAADTELRSLDDLRPGDRVCVTTGSPGASVGLPDGIERVEEADDHACLDLLGTEAVAIVTSTMLEADFATRGVVAVSDPVLIDARGAIVTADADTDSLASVVEGAFRDLASSGRLASLSRAAFGVDLTEPAR
jgi:ABC-type amino acid transport substrate-binding protein